MMGFICLVDEIKFMLISSHHFCINIFISFMFSSLCARCVKHIFKDSVHLIILTVEMEQCTFREPQFTCISCLQVISILKTVMHIFAAPKLYFQCISDMYSAKAGLVNAKFSNVHAN